MVVMGASEYDRLTRAGGKTAPPHIAYRQLFRYADCVDRLLLLCGLATAVVSSLCLPAMVVLLGLLTDAFVNHHGNSTQVTAGQAMSNSSRSAPTDLVISDGDPADGLSLFDDRGDVSLFGDHVVLFIAGCCITAAVQFILSSLFVFCLNFSAARQVNRIRSLFFGAALRQELAWYEMQGVGAFSSRMTEDLAKVEAGMDDKLGMFVAQLCVFCVSMVNALLHGWKLTLIIVAAVPVLALAVFGAAQVQRVLTRRGTDSYTEAAAVAVETLSSISTVMAFGGQQKAVDKYSAAVLTGRKWWVLNAALTGMFAGIVWLTIFSLYALTFWYGTELVLLGEYEPSSLIIVFFSVMTGAIQLGQATPFLASFSEAQSAAAAVFQVIERVSAIDPLGASGAVPDTVFGDVEFRNVIFHYPARSDVEVLCGLSFEVRSGETVALVGASGCGKSTCLQLLQRLYDPDSGQILLDGRPLHSLNVSWLRGQLAVVPQDPVLFPTTIRENLLYGAPDSSPQQVERAARAAQAWQFIEALPSGLGTTCGGRLSGGQRQRLAIARALLAEPTVLLLDEATSALDLQTESRLLNALKQMRGERRLTTVVVAHRLSTVRSADQIFVLFDGRLAERGSHDQLMAARGRYHALVAAQTLDDGEDGADDEDDSVIDRRGGDGRRASLSGPTAGGWRRSTRSWGRAGTLRRLKRTLSLRNSARRSYTADTELGGDSTEDAADVVISPAQTTADEHGGGGMLRLLHLSRPEWPCLLLAVLASAVCGCALPVYAMFFGNVLANLSESDPVVAQETASYYSLIFLGVGIVMGVSMFLQGSMYGIAGVRLTARLRRMAFSAVLRQDMAFFDDPQHSVGALSSRLSADAASIHGACGPRLGNMAQAVVTLVFATSLATYLSWRLAAVLVPFVPLVLLACYLQTSLMSGRQLSHLTAIDKGASIAEDALRNIASVAALRLEVCLHQQYTQLLNSSFLRMRRVAFSRGLVYGFANAVPMLAYAACMGYGGKLVSQGSLQFQDVFKAGESLILGTMMVGQAVAFSPSYQLAKLSAARIFALLDRKPSIDISPGAGLRMTSVTGDVTLDSVTFRYPSRPTASVLRRLSLSIPSGACVALVGSSGCGKSTVIRLLMRLYDPNTGSLTLDGQDIGGLNVPWYRSHLALVPQDSVMFSGTVADNIAYGDNSREVSRDDIEEAARQANLHDFICALPAGYNTQLGESAFTQLSGGERQRLAIARALLRRPRLLLLDEATSALDAHSSACVQRSLTEAARGLTCLLVTHRLAAAAQSAQLILLLHRGRVAEAGTHKQLMQQRGKYYQLYRAQL